ncbi:hypothetical protein V1478_003152 [Vespula squamosa]|uniref:Uncharacterized protein n=1 Tax=Vespula squamosa TaxID=30214 RepID=A0ABD2BRW8_VESSQ
MRFAAACSGSVDVMRCIIHFYPGNVEPPTVFLLTLLPSPPLPPLSPPHWRNTLDTFYVLSTTWPTLTEAFKYSNVTNTAKSTDIRAKKNVPSVNPSRIYGDSWEMEEGR